MLDFVEDEKTLNNLFFMKNKLKNRLTTHLELYVRIFSLNFFTLFNFPYDDAIALWKEVTSSIVNLISSFIDFC